MSWHHSLPAASLLRARVTASGTGIHELLRHPRLVEHGALRDVVLDDLGHVDDLLDRRGHVEVLQDTHQLDYRLRHRSIEIKHLHRHEGLDHLLHGLPLPVALAAHLDGVAALHRAPARSRRPWRSTACGDPLPWLASVLLHLLLVL